MEDNLVFDELHKLGRLCAQLHGGQRTKFDPVANTFQRDGEVVFLACHEILAVSLLEWAPRGLFITRVLHFDGVLFVKQTVFHFESMSALSA